MSNAQKMVEKEWVSLFFLAEFINLFHIVVCVWRLGAGALRSRKTFWPLSIQWLHIFRGNKCDELLSRWWSPFKGEDSFKLSTWNGIWLSQWFHLNVITILCRYHAKQISSDVKIEKFHRQLVPVCGESQTKWSIVTWVASGSYASRHWKTKKKIQIKINAIISKNTHRWIK